MAGVVGGWAVAAGGRKHDRQMTAQRFSYERRLAADQWHRQHRGDVYVQMLGLVERVGNWVNQVHPMWDTDPPRPLPDLPDLDHQLDTWARVGAFGSEPVKNALEVWREAAGAAFNVAREVTRDVDGARQQLDQLRAQEQRARKALHHAVARDLAVDGEA